VAGEQAPCPPIASGRSLSLLQGLLPCQHCGYAFDGKRLSPSARQGKPRAYAYSRCLGTDAYRFGGERLCPNTQVRPDVLDLAVWQEVCPLLTHPERLAEEYRRRLQPETRAKRTPLATIEGQMGQRRQGVARLIDSDAEGLIDKGAFAPRVTRLRQRLARLEAPRQAVAEEAALHGALQLIIGRLDDFAAKLHDGLEAADWTNKRDLIRALVKRVEVARDDVNIVFRIDPYPGDADPEKKVCNFVGRVVSPLLANVFLHACDDWDVRTYRVRPEWAHLAPSSIPYRRRKTLGGTLMLTRYADDWVAIWNGSRARAEDIKAEIAAFLADSLKLRLAEDKTRITHIDDGFDFVGYRLKGDKRWADGKWCWFSRVPPKARQRFREAVKAITRKTFTDAVAAFTALAGWIRGGGNS
jgi:hypothetical protein